jgi:ADP-heptose:LPS heptosyltransferase
MRILFVTSSRIGDAVLTTGLLDHLLHAHPDARFTVACGPAARDLFLRLPRLERLIVFDKRRFGLHWLALWAQCARTCWDLVVDVRGSALAWLVPTLRRAVMRRRRGDRMRHKTVQLAAILGLDPPPMPVAWTGPQDRDLAARLLPEGPPIIAIGPTANWTGKLWPPDRFAALARALATETGGRIAVFAGPGPQEAALAAPVIAALPGAIDLAGRLSLPEAAACLRRCALFVGNDSGLMHLAAAAGCPTLGLFGAVNASVTEYAPAGRRTAVAVTEGGGMAGISVAAALAAARGLLSA